MIHCEDGAVIAVNFNRIVWKLKRFTQTSTIIMRQYIMQKCLINNSNLTYFDVDLNSCWISRDAFHFAFLLPLGLVMFTNIILFAKIIKGLFCDRPLSLQSNQAKDEMMRLQVLAVICCFILMGINSHCTGYQLTSRSSISLSFALNVSVWSHIKIASF